MKELIYFNPQKATRFFRENGQNLNLELFDECRRRFPGFFPNNPDIMEVSGIKGDSSLDEVIAFLHENGRDPWMKRFPECPSEHPSFYPTKGKRVFELEDFAKAQYFNVIGQTLIATSGDKKDDESLLVSRSKILGQPIGRIYGYADITCTNSIKEAMEAEGFCGLTFKAVAIEGQEKLVEPLWQVWSDRQVPHILNRLVCDDGTDFDPKKRMGCGADDYYWPELLRFPVSDMRGIEPFDVALTADRFGRQVHPNYQRDYVVVRLEPYLIVSRRFREWCAKRELKLDFYPVMLE